ncbi:hypothetical protein FQA39_LY06160 [Lamprigera yunnana]|nr:hypothetical protein FQA39_LY06160 [Lamprigera yunnana]
MENVTNRKNRSLHSNEVSLRLKRNIATNNCKKNQQRLQNLLDAIMSGEEGDEPFEDSSDRSEYQPSDGEETSCSESNVPLLKRSKRFTDIPSTYPSCSSTSTDYITESIESVVGQFRKNNFCSEANENELHSLAWGEANGTHLKKFSFTIVDCLLNSCYLCIMFYFI